MAAGEQTQDAKKNEPYGQSETTVARNGSPQKKHVDAMVSPAVGVSS